MKAQKKNVAGGSALAGGADFQAAVTAIANIHVAAGLKLGWFDGVVEDTPASLCAETAGPGDDIRLEFLDASVAEIQAKSGLQKGERLWEPLLSMAGALSKNEISYASLVVSSSSSRTITKDLSKDIRRVGDGRSDALSAIGQEFVGQLILRSVDPELVCSKLRIVTMHCDESDSASLTSARTILATLLGSEQVELAWGALYRDAINLIKRRGRRTPESVWRVLRSGGVVVQSRDLVNSPLSISARVSEWTTRTNSSFSIFGVSRQLSIAQSWIPMKTVVQKEAPVEQPAIKDALNHYHSWEKRDGQSAGNEVDPAYLGRFIRHCVVVAGPGMGKSTLLKKLATVYSDEGYPTIVCKLPAVAARIKTQGSTFEEAVFSLGLDGSTIGHSDTRRAGFHSWVLLLDGLDECGGAQEFLAEKLVAYVSGHVECRVIVTTRPIGYRSTLLQKWRHYELLPLRSSDVDDHLRMLLTGILQGDKGRTDESHKFAKAAIAKNSASAIVSRSPLLLGLVASLASRRVDIGSTKAQLYERLFQIIDDLPSDRIEDLTLTNAVLTQFLNLLGWDLQQHPFDHLASAMKRCASAIVREMRLTQYQAAEVCEKCLRYWEGVGVLERVLHGGDEAITFIHKTLGEYAAARFLLSLPANEQSGAVAAQIDNDMMSEVLMFATSLGAIDLVIAELLLRSNLDVGESNALNRCLRIIESAEVAISIQNRETIFARALSAIGSNHRLKALRVGAGLLRVAHVFEAELKGTAASWISSSHSWTRLVGWAVIAKTDVISPDMAEMVNFLSEMPASYGDSFAPSLFGGLSLDDSGSSLVDLFAVYAINRVIERYPVEKSDEILGTFLDKHYSRNPKNIGPKIQALLRQLEKPHLANKVKVVNHSAWLGFPGEETLRSRTLAEKAFLRSLDNDFDSPLVEDEVDLSHFVELSAFLTASNYWRTYDGDLDGLGDTTDADVTHEVWRSLFALTGIESGRVRQAVRALLNEFSSNDFESGLTTFDGHLKHVDFEVDWDRVKEISVSLPKLERALHHPSRWIVENAAVLIANKYDATDLLVIAARVMQDGKDHALWAAAVLAKYARPETCAEIIIQRLEKSVPSGSRFLFEALLELSPKITPALFGALHNGLLGSGPYTADAAAAVALKIAAPGMDTLETTLREAYVFWLKKEAAEAEKADKDEKSARANILAARLKISSPPNAEILEFSSDPRHDVKNVATPMLLAKLMSDDECRSSFLVSVASGKHSPRQLKDAIVQKTPFSRIQCESVLRLLEHDSSSMRFAATYVLDRRYLTAFEIRVKASMLSRDADPEVQEKANLLLAELDS